MIEKHVTSFELSKELKEAGYPQEECLFYWIIFKNGDKSLSIFSNLGIGDVSEENYEKYAAPTASEILERLPAEIKVDGIYRLNLKNSFYDDKMFDVSYVLLGNKDKDCFCVYSENISNSLAETYIYLKDNELIKP